MIFLRVYNEYERCLRLVRAIVSNLHFSKFYSRFLHDYRGKLHLPLPISFTKCRGTNNFNIIATDKAMWRDESVDIRSCED
jgi:hypothetical protein